MRATENAEPAGTCGCPLKLPFLQCCGSLKKKKIMFSNAEIEVFLKIKCVYIEMFYCANDSTKN
jgi:hypothetical protein